MPLSTLAVPETSTGELIVVLASGLSMMIFRSPGIGVAAVDRVPEDLVEDSQVRPEGVVGHVAEDREDAVEHEVDRRQAGHEEGLDANQAVLNVTHGERDI